MHLHISYDVPDWNAGGYRDTVKPCDAARPWKMVHPQSSDIAVVLCTGYAGYPGELVRPGDDLYHRGYDVFCPREAGCGTSGADFQRTGWQDWIASADACLREQRRAYQIVYLVGHSMGGLTAILLAEKYGVSRLVLLAPALDLPAFDREGALADLEAMGDEPRKAAWKPDPSYHLHYEGAPKDDAYLGSQYWSWTYPKQLRSLYELQRRALAVLPSLKANTRVITGGKDVLVGPKAASPVLAKPLGYNDEVHVAGATHFSMYDPDPKAEDEAMAAVVSWLDA